MSGDDSSSNASKEKDNEKSRKEEEEQHQLESAPPGSWIVQHDKNGQPFWYHEHVVFYWVARDEAPRLSGHKYTNDVDRVQLVVLLLARRNNEHGQMTYHLSYLPFGPRFSAMTQNQQQGFVPAFAAAKKKATKDVEKKKDKKQCSSERKNPPALPKILKMWTWEEFEGPFGKKFWRHPVSGKRMDDDPYC